MKDPRQDDTGNHAIIGTWGGHTWTGTRSFAISVLTVGMVTVQAGASIAKDLLPRFGPYTMTLLRLSIASVILCAIQRPWRHPLTSGQRWRLLLYGMALGAMNLSFYLSLSRIPLGIAVSLEFAGPLFLTVSMSRRMHDFLWIGLALLGFLSLVPHHVTGVKLDPLGVVFAFLAGGAWCLYIIFGQRAGADLPSGVTSSTGMLIAACTVLPICGWHLSPVVSTLPLWGLILAVAVLSSVIPYTVEMIALQRMPAKTFGILLSVEPAIAALLGLVFLHEHLMTMQWLGIVCVVTASIGSVATIPSPIVAVDG